MSPLTISVVVPTRNRPESLTRLLSSLSRQERLPDQIIIVDASDRPVLTGSWRNSYRSLNIEYVRTTPSVCRQRNTGIARARGSHILLCDDDIEPGPDYLRRLASYVERHPETGAVTGTIARRGPDGTFIPGFRTPSFRRLLFNFVFQLTVWGDVEATPSHRLTRLLLRIVQRWYRRRGNTWSLAGWPLVTQVRAPVIRSAVYGLGAALVSREWLLASPYDERLGAHGIGDNYGVAVGFPEVPGIAVLTDVQVRHHENPENRLGASEAYFQRVLALHYFLRRVPRRGVGRTLFLLWSLCGNALAFSLRGQGGLLGVTLRAIGVIIAGRNPLLAAPNSVASSPPPQR